MSGALAAQLEKELARGAAPGAVRSGGRIEDAAVLVRVLAGAPTEEDERELREAKRAKVPVVAVQTGTEAFDVPYVLATDVVMCKPGAGFPVEEIAAAIAARLGEARHGACGAGARAARARVRRADRAVLAAERHHRRRRSSSPAPTSPVLTLNQIRLVLRLAVGPRARDRPEPPPRGARDGRCGVRLPCRRAAAARGRSRRRLAREGRHRLRRHARARRGGAPLFRQRSPRSTPAR